VRTDVRRRQRVKGDIRPNAGESTTQGLRIHPPTMLYFSLLK
jgi:hypothetical protein